MKKLIFLFALFIYGCSIDASVLHRADYYCKDHLGIDKIEKIIGTAYVYCNDGKQTKVDNIIISQTEKE